MIPRLKVTVLRDNDAVQKAYLEVRDHGHDLRFFDTEYDRPMDADSVVNWELGWENVTFKDEDRDDFSKKPQIIKENNMDTKPDEILKDSRPVIGLFNSSGDRYAQIGFDGVTRIEVYGQGAMHCDIPWAAIYKGDKLDRRINLQFVCEVYYGG